MRVAVIGSTGVLGRALIPLLLKHDHAVRAFARSIARAREVLPAEIEIAEGDLLDARLQQQLPALLEDCAAVIHIATAIPSNMSAPGAWDANNRLRTDGTRVLLQAALQAGVQQYLQQSISMAYPDHGDEWITEDMPLDTSPERAEVNASVIVMEDLVRTLSADRLRWCILRGGRFVGPGTFEENTVADLRHGTRGSSSVGLCTPSIDLQHRG